jgi:diguanylate cyclase (GGDEF)-like protein
VIEGTIRAVVFPSGITGAPLRARYEPVSPGVWVAIVGAALVLPWWAAVAVAPALQLTAAAARRQRVEWWSVTSTLAAASAAWAAAWRIPGNGEGRLALAGLAAFGAGLVARRLLVEQSFEHVESDAVWAALGVVVAVLYRQNPWLIPFAALPPLLISRSLSIPRLQQEARLDSKTGLFNARYFGQAVDRELARARRFRRPASLIMADLDLLRDTNNTYGHLAGDAVLRGIADIFRAQLRAHDVPARFGGEEFSILLPETGPAEAIEIAERIRHAVEVRSFRAETSPQPLRATISLGVASYPRDAEDVTQLIHRADLAVYQAKLAGRNRVAEADLEPTERHH